jgi:pyruvate,water dikinase
MAWPLSPRLRSLLRARSRRAPDLGARIACFREVLHANNAALGFIAEIQRALAGERETSAGDVRSLIAGVTVQTYRMISNLNRMTGDKYASLVGKFDEIRAHLARSAEVTPFLGTVGAVVRLEDADGSFAEVVGQKSAFLGAARRVLTDRVPPGFATTVRAYEQFTGQHGLREETARVIAALDPGDVAGCFAAAARVTQLVEAQEVPPAVREAIEAEVGRLVSQGCRRVAVRSSALQEGGREMSFAGQYRSLLNVEPAGVVDAFRQVIASKYSPQAITYRLGRGFDDDEVAMCCCVIAMVDAEAAGVAYTAFPADGEVRTVVQAVRGLGISAVDGSVEPDSFVVDRKTRRLVRRKRGVQRSLLQCAEGEGTEKLELQAARPDATAISERQAMEVAGLAWRLEDALASPVDVEWAIDRSGKVFILQVRPQCGAGGDAGVPQAAPIAGETVLLAGGSRASGGVGCGPVHPVETDLDILRCPAGAIVVASEANPRLAVLLPKAAGVVADMGEVTGHLATVARELRVPALFAARSATQALTAGAIVTVDADAGVVYAGRVEGACARVAGRGAAAGARKPHVELLASVAEEIVPLTLRDRLASGYSPRRCRTLHDMIRFCHQATVEEMFELGDRALSRGAAVRRLVSEVPIDCRVLDLGGGLRDGAAGDITIEDVVCVPMRALWQGLADPRLRWRMTRPVSL